MHEWFSTFEECLSSLTLCLSIGITVNLANNTRAGFVLQDPQSGGEIACCEYGFGPRCPWGLVSSADEEHRRHMGMDSGWFTTFLDAFFDSFACVELPIWRVIKVEADGTRTQLTDEDGWDATWRRISELRTHDPTGRYDCGHSIAY
jgi:hypothetical protein